MKNLFSLLFFLIPILSFAQTTHTVGEGVAGIYDFETVQAAHDAASSGDTILVHPLTVYNNYVVTISKPLYFVGSGYFLTENNQTQQFYGESTISPTITSGSEGTVFDGLTVYFPTFSIDDITIIRCNASMASSTIYGDNLVIQNCDLSITNVTLEGNNAVISNNIIDGGSSSFLDIGQAVVFEHNTSLRIPNFSAAIIRNNIFYATNSCTSNTILEPSDANVIQHNIFYDNGCNQLDGINGNFTDDFEGTFQGNAINTILLGWPNNISSFSQDAAYQLTASSLAIGAGVGGVDIGAFGGATPYTLSGMPNRPFVYEINMPADNGTNPTLNVEVKIKAH